MVSVRKHLPSLLDSFGFDAINPALKRWAIFKTHVGDDVRRL